MSDAFKPAKQYHYRLFRIRRSDGRVTTASLDPILVTHAIKLMGGPKPVGQFVRDVALAYTDGTYRSCSGYIAKQLETHVSKLDADRRRAAAAASAAASADSVKAAA